MHGKIKAIDEGKKKKTMKDLIDEKKFGEKMQPVPNKNAEDEAVEQKGKTPAWLGKKKPGKV